MRLAPLLVLALAAGCSAPPGRPDAGRGRPDGFYGEGEELPDGGTQGEGDAGLVPADAGPGCLAASPVRAQAIRDCLDQGRSPNTCTLEQGNERYCDSDNDGLFDDLEVALGGAYAAAFAFNAGGWGGDPETTWPGNVTHFASRARLVYRPNSQPEQLVKDTPTLDELWQATVTIGGNIRRAYDPASGAGSDFWLCLNDASDATRVTSKAAMLALPDGVDILSVVQPANGNLGASTHLFVATGLFYPYNLFAGFDNHEGDWETVVAFVNRATGAVEAAWFDRHGSSDNTRFVDVATYGVKNPATEAPSPAVTSSDPTIHGLRFWDHGGVRHHVIAYAATGSHAMYDYPGNTAIVPNGTRDTHAGDGDKFAPWLGRLYPGFNSGTPQLVKTQFFNPGQWNYLTLNWARFRGQWGCDNQAVAVSWPGPYGNARHPRPLFERAWGSPPVAP